jgi:antitoxin FitA
MPSVTVDLPEERFSALRARATTLGVAPEDLVRVSIEELLRRPQDDFQRAVDYVLQKNVELYRRLA